MSKEPGPVLLAYDGSESSAAAIAVAGQLLNDGPAVVCHVWTGLSRAILHSDPAGLPGTLRDAAAELDCSDLEAAQQAAADGARLATAAGFDAAALPVRESRKTWRTLVEAAEGCQASLIVAGAHGMSGVGRALLGSVSTALVHHSRVPVLVVPATARHEGTDGPLLLCYDASEPAKRAMTQASKLLRPRPALVLHLWESWAAEAPALAGVSRSVQGMTTELDEIADAQSREATADGVASAELAGFDATGLSVRAAGPIWSAVLDAAGEHACAAIVVGSRGLSGISAALGSVSNGVVHHSRRPVVVVPTEEAER